MESAAPGEPSLGVVVLSGCGRGASSIPFLYNAGMQLAQIVHGVVAVLFVAAMLGHIYIGTIGMEGAFEAMAEGTVDENWAKQHHCLWLEEEKSKAPTGATPRASPAE